MNKKQKQTRDWQKKSSFSRMLLFIELFARTLFSSAAQKQKQNKNI
jgi:hypothetical protein